MKKFIYVQVYLTYISDPLKVKSTDPSTLDWIFREIKSKIPSCESKNEYMDLSGARYSFELHRLKDKDQQVSQWVIKMLCENGYEPFSSDSNDNGITRTLHFRKEIDA